MTSHGEHGVDNIFFKKGHNRNSQSINMDHPVLNLNAVYDLVDPLEPPCQLHHNFIKKTHSHST